ncbi:MAG: patatin-like phospholipase family protein [Nitrososphaera sp.]
MSKIQKEDEVKLPTEYKLVAYIAPIGVVTEGSEVQLDGSQSYLEYANNNKYDNKLLNSARPLKVEDGISFLWKQIEGPKVILDSQDSSMPSFTAPYLDLENTSKKIHMILRFQLIIRDKNGLLSEPYREQVVVKIAQRALVLQGGGALGAYEAGVFNALCEDLARKNEEKHNNNNNNNRMLFDIVAGTSIGAVNAATIVGTMLNYKRDHPQANQRDVWQYSAKELEKFWSEISDPLTLMPKGMRDNPLYSSWLSNGKNANEFGGQLLSNMWDFGKTVGDTSVKNYNRVTESTQRQIGDKWPWAWPYVPVFTEDEPYFRLMSWKDNWKEEWPYISGFFYWPENYGSLATSEALRRYYTYVASLFYGVPRVLLPGITQPDMEFPLGLSPTFTRFDNSPLARSVKRYWDYEKYPIKTSFDKGEPRLILVSVDMLDATTAVAFDSYADQNDICVTEYGDNEFKHIIEYPEGITIKHVIASMSTHLRYKYQEMKVKNKDEGRKEEERESRLFWDGAYLSNTPLRELLHMHKNYWQNVRKETVELGEGKESITLAPDLEIYIVNLYPTIEKEVPVNPDTIQDREIDIKFHDRTKYDVKVAEMTTDYLELIEQLINIGYKHAEYDSAFKADLKTLLDEKTKSKKRSGEKRTYRDILDGRADITKVVYIDRRDDGNTIFGKAFEFSSKTIKELEASGYKDAKIAIHSTFLRNTITDLHDKSLLTEEDESSLEEKLSKVMTYVKHEYPQKAVDALDYLIEEVGRISANNEAAEKNSKLSELAASARMLQKQLTNSRQTQMI